MSKSSLLLDIPLYNGTYSGFLKKIENPKKKTLVFTPNPEIFLRASRESEFMDMLKAATYNVPDANGLYVGFIMQEWQSFLQAGWRTFFRKREIEKMYGELIKGSDLTRDILESGKDDPKKVLILDRSNDVPKSAFEKKKAAIQKNLKHALEEKYPWITVWVVFDGEMAQDGIAHLIELQHIDIVFSCIGMKEQEKRLIEIFSYLPEDQKVVGLGVGASIDFLLGLQKRAPRVFQDLGLEWLYRLAMQPRVRARRIWDAVYHFPQLIKNSSKD